MGCQDGLRRRRRGTRPDVPAQRTRTNSTEHPNSHCDGNVNNDRHAKPHCHRNTNSDGHAKSYADGHPKSYADRNAKSDTDDNRDFDAGMSYSDCYRESDGHPNFQCDPNAQFNGKSHPDATGIVHIISSGV